MRTKEDLYSKGIVSNPKFHSEIPDFSKMDDDSEIKARIKIQNNKRMYGVQRKIELDKKLGVVTSDNGKGSEFEKDKIQIS